MPNSLTIETPTAPTLGDRDLVLQQAPAEAFAFEVSRFQFRDNGSPQEKTRAVELLALSGEPLRHWYWGRIVQDLAQMQHADRIPIDYRHDDDQAIGYIDRFDTADGLKLGGELVSVREGDQAETVMLRGDGGIPYQASIFWDSDTVEYVDEGVQVSVNGRDVVGPIWIVRQWQLRGVAVCLYGVDTDTATRFQSTRPLQFSRLKPMTKTTGTTTAPESTQPTAAAGTQQSAADTSPAPAAVPVATPAAAPAAAGQQSGGSDLSELERFCQRFGNEQGVQFFRDRVPYADACEQTIDAQRDQIKQQADQIAELQKQVSDAGIGHQGSIDTGDAEPTDGPTDNRGKFSALFKKRS